MAVPSFGIVIAPSDASNDIEPVNKALRSIVALTGVRPSVAVRLVGNRSAVRRLVVVPSTADAAVHRYLGEVLALAYGSQLDDTGLGRDLYLLVRIGDGSTAFRGLCAILDHIGVGAIVSAERLIPTVLRGIPPTPFPVPSALLRQQIETAIYPSGAAEMLELLLRDSQGLHDLLRLLRVRDRAHRPVNGVHPADEASPAIRLLIGAYHAGDIDHRTFARVVASLCRRLRRTRSVSREVKSWLQNAIAQAEAARDRLLTKMNGEIHTASLCEYLAGRRLLFIEDQHREQCWDLVLPALFGQAKTNLPNGRRTLRISQPGNGKLTLTRARTVSRVLENPRAYNLAQYDIVLVDLYSSEATAAGHDREASPLSTIREPIRHLAKSIERLYDRKDTVPFGGKSQAILTQSIDSVPTAVPQIVVFSRDTNGLTTRTMIKELGAIDYFFKLPKGEPHKGGYYATFRNAIIGALKATVGHILALPHCERHRLFDDWLGQFRPEHRPIVLRVMRHFRYYSAKSITGVLDRYLYWRDGNPQFINGELASILGGGPRAPSTVWVSYLGRPNKSGPATLPLLAKTEWFRSLADAIVGNLKEQGRESDLPKCMPVFMSYEDLQEELARKLLQWRPEDRLQLVLIDDFIGSAGQLSSYLWKFVNRHLPNALRSECGLDTRSDLADSVWQGLSRPLREDLYEGDANGGIQLHVLYGVGLHNPFLQEAASLPRRRKRRDGTYEPFFREPGHISVAICQNRRDHGDPGTLGEEAVQCSCPRNVHAVVHIADYVDNIADACVREGLDGLQLIRILRQYMGIVRAREGENPHWFEPIGWKCGGGMVATYANAPGNTLPIIWGEGGEPRWKPLFQRFFNPWDTGAASEPQTPCSMNPGTCPLCGDRALDGRGALETHQCRDGGAGISPGA